MKTCSNSFVSLVDINQREMVQLSVCVFIKTQSDRQGHAMIISVLYLISVFLT